MVLLLWRPHVLLPYGLFNVFVIINKRIYNGLYFVMYNYNLLGTTHNSFRALTHNLYTQRKRQWCMLLFIIILMLRSKSFLLKEMIYPMLSNWICTFWFVFSKYNIVFYIKKKKKIYIFTCLQVMETMWDCIPLIIQTHPDRPRPFFDPR